MDFEEKKIFLMQILSILTVYKLPWDHLRSHKKFEPDQFSRFVSYRLETIKGCYGNAPPRKSLTKEMPHKPLLRNFRFILGNPSKLEMGQIFLNVFELFPNIYS